MTAAIVIGALVSALILFRLPVILQMLGATSLLMADCKAYIYWWLFGAPIVVGKEMFTYFIRVDGSPTYSFLTALSGGIFNIVFDYILSDSSIWELQVPHLQLSSACYFLL